MASGNLGASRLTPTSHFGITTPCEQRRGPRWPLSEETVAVGRFYRSVRPRTFFIGDHCCYCQLYLRVFVYCRLLAVKLDLSKHEDHLKLGRHCLDRPAFSYLLQTVNRTLFFAANWCASIRNRRRTYRLGGVPLKRLSQPPKFFNYLCAICWVTVAPTCSLGWTV